MKGVILLLSFTGALSAQILVEGGVYDALSGAPLRDVSLSSGAPNGQAARSDVGGHFRLQFDPAYASVLAFKPGYLQSVQVVPSRSPQAFSQLRIELRREAVITGKVEDEDGFPIRAAYVEAMSYTTIDGPRRLWEASRVQSDEQGLYRIDGLPAGRYFLRVYSDDAANWDGRFVAQYQGGAMRPDENRAVEVKTGEVRKGADIRMARIEGVTISGRLEGVAPDPRAGPPTVLMRGNTELIGDMYRGNTRSGSDFDFTIRHVPPGSYKLHYGSTEPRAGDSIAELPLEVADHDISNLVLTAHTVAPIDIEGQISLREGGAPGAWIVSAQSTTGRSAMVKSNEDGTFVLKGLLPQHYRLQAAPDRSGTPAMPSMAHMVSAKVGDREIPQSGFDVDGSAQTIHITATQQFAAFSGTAVDSQGAPLTNTALYFVSSQAALRGFVTTDDKGTFHTALAEAGDYRVYLAVDGSRELENDGDFPVVHAALGENPPVRLVRNPQAAR
jgi:Carboxypeptidase regulatory-like domain